MLVVTNCLSAFVITSVILIRYRRILPFQSWDGGELQWRDNEVGPVAVPLTLWGAAVGAWEERIIGNMLIDTSVRLGVSNPCSSTLLTCLKSACTKTCPCALGHGGNS